MLEDLPTVLPEHVLSKRGREQPDRRDRTRVKMVSNNTLGCTEDLTSRVVEEENRGLGNRCTLQHVNRSRASEALPFLEL
jgi:hypothetical protein